jgi:3'-phosphoadenosine 5'-phosphosulfate sulfotransferase (PAPS reductase)/FAD synthetase
MEKKINNALKNIETCLKHSSKPVLAWSGGKDSMALLDLVSKKVGAKIPVFFFVEQWQPGKYSFKIESSKIGVLRFILGHLR